MCSGMMPSWGMRAPVSAPQVGTHRLRRTLNNCRKPLLDGAPQQRKTEEHFQLDEKVTDHVSGVFRPHYLSIFSRAL